MVVEEATCLFFFVLPSSIRRDNNEAKFKEATDLAKLIKYENSQKEKLFVLYRSQLSKQHLWIFDETAKDTNTLTNKSLDGGGGRQHYWITGSPKSYQFFWQSFWIYLKAHSDSWECGRQLQWTKLYFSNLSQCTLSLLLSVTRKNCQMSMKVAQKWFH